MLQSWTHTSNGGSVAAEGGNICKRDKKCVKGKEKAKEESHEAVFVYNQLLRLLPNPLEVSSLSRTRVCKQPMPRSTMKLFPFITDG